ncbi:MAG: TIGR03067 domain-containing protein [Gemmataceae bacterium]|nr:TIGR03067 domain-containing protein [Gemmataceae bacterium]
MRTRLLFVAFALWLAGGIVLAGGDERKELKALQGAWKADKNGKTLVLTFKGKDFTVEMEGDGKQATVKGTVKIDASKDPKHIDMIVKEGTGEGEKFAGKTSLGIFELKGDELKWCANEPGKEGRPPEFTEKGDGDARYMLVTLKREKK